MNQSAVVAPPHLGRPLRLHPFRGLTLAPRWIGGKAPGRTFARPYRDVSRRLRNWERTGRVSRDAESALYLHEYLVEGVRVRGLVGALDLTRRSEALAERSVLPHEGVHLAQVEDLAARLQEMWVSPAPIVLVHRASPRLRTLVGEVARTSPTRAFLDQAGVRHRLWAIRDSPTLSVIEQELLGASPVIADGHHRYAAYLRLQQQRPGTSWDRGLAMLVDQDDTPLRIRAIHRVVPRVRWARLESVAEGLSSPPWQPLAGQQAAQRLLGAPDEGPATVVVTDGHERWAAWHLPRPEGAAAVETLHDAVIPTLAAGRRLRYEHSIDRAAAVARSTSGVAMLLPGPSFDLVHDVVAHDRLLPEKATSFQPKPAPGVLMRDLRDG